MNLTLKTAGLSKVLTAIRLPGGTSLVLRAGDTLEAIAITGDIIAWGLCPATIEKVGSVSVDPKQFAPIVQALKGKVTLRTEKRNLVIESGPIRFTIPCEDDEAPIFSYPCPTQVDGPAFARVINQTSFALPVNDDRYGLNGAHIEHLGDKLRMVTTDGFRLAYAECFFEGELKIPPKFLIPREALKIAGRMLDGPASFGFDDQCFVLSCGPYRLWARLENGEFPPYRKVLPGPATRTAVIECAALREALPLVKLMAIDRCNTSKWSFESGKVVISTNRSEFSDLGTIRYELPVEYTSEPLVIGLKVGFVQDVLADEKLLFSMDTPLSPVIITPVGKDDALFVVSPIRLD